MNQMIEMDLLKLLLTSLTKKLENEYSTSGEEMNSKKRKDPSHHKKMKHRKYCNCMYHQDVADSMMEEVEMTVKKEHYFDPSMQQMLDMVKFKPWEKHEKEYFPKKKCCSYEKYHCEEYCKCQHPCKCKFTKAEDKESEFHPKRKKHDKEKDFPHIWLSDLLQLLYKNGMLNLDPIYEAMEDEDEMESSEMEFEKKAAWKCHHDKYEDYYDSTDYKFEHKDECKCKHKTKYYYGDLPLKSIRKKRSHFSSKNSKW